MERFFLSLKMERVWRRDYANHAEAIRDITEYIVGFTTTNGCTRNWDICHRPFTNGRWRQNHLSRCPELVDHYRVRVPPCLPGDSAFSGIPGLH